MPDAHIPEADPSHFKEPIRIVVLVGWFLPGFKAGGPIRTLANLVERLSDHYRFTVLTRDRDLGDQAPYPTCKTVKSAQWGHVEYLRDDAVLSAQVVRRLRKADFEVLYCNSLFSVPFSIVPLWSIRLRLIAKRPTIVAPRGELSPAALTRNLWKKRLFLKLGKMAGIYHRVLWHATDEVEASRIRAWFGRDVAVQVVPNLATKPRSGAQKHVAKVRNELRLLFVGRVARMKNLLGALEILKRQQGTIRYDVFGPLEDESYLERCRAAIHELPEGVEVNLLGPIEHERVAELMRQYDLLFLPTLGENFGHVIAEALSTGLPVLISDRTPWRDLDRHCAGWDLPLEDTAGFDQVLSRCAAMGEDEFARLRAGAMAFGRTIMSDEGVVRRSYQLFARASALSACD